MDINLTYQDSIRLLKILMGRHDIIPEINSKNNLLTYFDDVNEKIFDFRPPLPIPQISAISESALFSELPLVLPPPYLILLIQAGNSALAYIKEGKIEKHKVIKKYMVRKKQGKSQISYLKTKGKSRAGSRVRLANAVLFFEEINAKLQEWTKGNEVGRILYSWPVSMSELIYNSKIKPPFEKKDSRLIKIPMDVNIPNFAELQRVNRFVMKGYLRQYKENNLVKEMLGEIVDGSDK
ncbi:MAG: hypothetical protein AB7T22_08800 [Calditrichaceae bacterium]